ncbi:alpha/beta hydrolase family protein [Streptomyces sp. NPDC054784]
MTSPSVFSRRTFLASSGLAGATAALMYAAPGAPADPMRRGAHGDRPAPVRLRLPPPTGPYPVGTTEVPLVDRSRRDPWQPGRPRELMASVWYPARGAGGHTLAPHMRQGAAERFATARAPGFGVPEGTVDWAATRTHAYAGAPPDTRGGPRPVLLYSPGTGDPRTWGTVLVEELASRGYVVVTLDHTYESPAVQFPDGSVRGNEPMLAEFEEAQRNGTVPALLEKVLRVRVDDLRFVLDACERAVRQGGGAPRTDSPLARLAPVMDLSRVGALGQSAGGTTAAQGMYEDRRLRAGINLDGTLEYNQEPNGTNLMPVARHGLDRPFLLMGRDGSDHTTEPSWRAFWSHTRGWHRDLTLRRGKHQSYADLEALLPQTGVPREVLEDAVGTVDPARAVAAVRAYTTSFFDRWLLGRDDGLLDGPSPRHPDVAFVP